MDYKNAKVYQILNTVDDSVYVGSTCQPLSKRIAKHRSSLNEKRKQNSSLYQKMKGIGLEHFYIELLEEFPCESKEQLRKREGFYIRQIGTLNGVIAGRTKKEYMNDNQGKLSEAQRQYKQEHKDKIKESNKQYREENKDRINAYNKQYYEDNKDQWQTVICDCGCSVSKKHQTRHTKSKKHSDLLSLQSQTQNE